MSRIHKYCQILLLFVILCNCNKEDAYIGASSSLLKALIHRGIDTNDDGKISPLEASAVKTLDITNEQVSYLSGIQSFNNLDTLICEHNLLTSIDLSDIPGLLYLACGWNYDLTTLNISRNTALKHFSCGSHAIKSLDVSHNTALTYLECVGNQLGSLDVSKNVLLEWFSCAMNNLTTLDISNNKALKYFGCAGNQLERIDISMNQNLTTLNCSINDLTILDVSNNPKLTEINCNDNQLSTLNVSYNPELQFLRCGNNKFTSLNLSYNTQLIELNINDMPSLKKVCVVVRPFPKANVVVWSEGSPNIYYSTDCSN